MKPPATVPQIDFSPTEWLAQICQQYLLQPKWLMANRMMSAQCIKDAYNLRGGKCVQLRGQTLFTITSDALFQLSISGTSILILAWRIAPTLRWLPHKPSTNYQKVESSNTLPMRLAMPVSRSWLLVLSPTCGWRMCRLIAFTIHSLSVQEGQ